MTIAKERALKTVRKLKPRTMTAILGDGTGAVTVSGKANYAWIRLKYGSELGSPVTALNRNVPPINGRVVTVKEIEAKGHKGYEVIEFTRGITYYTPPDPAGELPAHGWTHECGPAEGSDPVNLYTRGWAELRVEAVDPAALYCYVTYGWYLFDTPAWFDGGYTPVFTPPVGALSKFDLVYIDSSGTIGIEQGNPLPAGTAAIPEPPDYTIPLAAIYFTGTATGGITDGMILDCRVMPNVKYGSGGVHFDDSITPSTIFPDDAPWAGATAAASRVDHKHGIDCAAPGTILAQDTVPTEGTATTFARADHEHGIDVGAPQSILAQDTAAAEGSSDEFVRKDHVHGIDVGIPGTILAQDTVAAEGSDTEFVRKDHVHGIDVGTPSSVGAANAEGSDTEFVRKDHVHQGVHSISKAGSAQLFGDVTLSQGANVTLTQVGQDIAIAASGGGDGGGAAGAHPWIPTWEYRGSLGIVVGAGVPIRAYFTGTIESVMLLVDDQGTAGQTTIDVNKAGVTIFTTQANRPTVAWNDGDNYDVQVPDVRAIALYDEFTVDYDATGTAAGDARVSIRTLVGY